MAETANGAARTDRGSPAPRRLNGHDLTMARQTSIESRLGRIEEVLERATEDRADANKDRAESNRKLDALTDKVNSILISKGADETTLRSLAAAVDACTRTINTEDCGRRLTEVERRLGNLEQPRELRTIDENRLTDCERGIKEFRETRQEFKDAKKTRSARLWQLIVVAASSSGLTELVRKLFHL